MSLALLGRLGEGQVDNEGRALPLHAVDGELAAVAGKEVLDEHVTEARAALLAALGNNDAIEPFGKARQMLRRDAGTMVAPRKGRDALVPRESNLDVLAGGAIFQYVLDQFLGAPH